MFAANYLVNWMGLIRFLVLFGLVCWMIVQYSDELRGGVIDLAQVPGFPVTPVTVAGTTVPGATMTVRTVLIIVWTGTMVFLPSVIVTMQAAVTVFAFGGGQGSAAAAASSNLGSVTGTIFAMVGKLLNLWYPLKELVVFAANYLVARMVLNGMVTFVSGVVKGMGS